MSKLTIISSKDMAKILESLGFKEIRQKGSHKSYKHADGRTTVVPFHGEDLGRGLIRKILKELSNTTNETMCSRYHPGRLAHEKAAKGLAGFIGGLLPRESTQVKVAAMQVKLAAAT